MILTFPAALTASIVSQFKSTVEVLQASQKLWGGEHATVALHSFSQDAMTAMRLAIWRSWILAASSTHLSRCACLCTHPQRMGGWVGNLNVQISWWAQDLAMQVRLEVQLSWQARR